MSCKTDAERTTNVMVFSIDMHVSVGTNIRLSSSFPVREKTLMLAKKQYFTSSALHRLNQITRWPESLFLVSTLILTHIVASLARRDDMGVLVKSDRDAGCWGLAAWGVWPLGSRVTTQVLTTMVISSTEDGTGRDGIWTSVGRGKVKTECMHGQRRPFVPGQIALTWCSTEP